MVTFALLQRKKLAFNSEVEERSVTALVKKKKSKATEVFKRKKNWFNVSANRRFLTLLTVAIDEKKVFFPKRNQKISKKVQSLRSEQP